MLMLATCPEAGWMPPFELIGKTGIPKFHHAGFWRCGLFCVILVRCCLILSKYRLKCLRQRYLFRFMSGRCWLSPALINKNEATTIPK